MLNISKIHSLLNYGDSNIAQISRGIKIPYTTLKSKIKADSWTPDDIEKLADYFKKPITYFFDRDEMEVVNESSPGYNRCVNCEEKQKEINRLRAEKDDLFQKYTECLEELLGKKREA